MARSESEPAAVEASGLHFAYGTREALSGVDLRVEAGQVVGLAGPNGSGKSTLIRVLSGVLGGYRGSARIHGREVRDTARRELAREMAVVPQEPVFGFPFSALAVALIGRHPHLAGPAFESERDLQLARAALARAGALDFAARSVLELSAGERQRVVFARALAQLGTRACGPDTTGMGLLPRTLLLDEPAAFLDIRHQVELYDVVRELARDEGVAVLTALHDLNLAAEYCDRIYLLRRGRVEAGGPTAEILTHANISRVFEIDVYVDVNARTGKPLVVPLPGRLRENRPRGTEG